MSLYGGKFGGAARHLSPDGVAHLRAAGRQLAVPVVTFSAAEASALLARLAGAQKRPQGGFLVDADGEKIGGGPVRVVVWGMTDGDTWRPCDEAKAIFVGWETRGIATVFQCDWKGWGGMMAAVRRRLDALAAASPLYNPQALSALLRGRDRRAAARAAGVSVSLLDKACMAHGARHLAPGQWNALLEWARGPADEIARGLT